MGAPVAIESAFTPRVQRESRERPLVQLTFSRVYELYAGFVWRTVRRLGVRERDVEDACQEVFLVVHRKIDGLEADPSLEAWLFAICRRVAAAHRRRASTRHERDELTATNEPSVAPNQSDALQRREARALLEAALDELDDPKREVFILFELERQPMTRVAELVGCPLKTAYARLYAARGQVEKSVRRAFLGRRLEG